MAEQRSGYVCRRLDKPGEYAGYEGTHTQWYDDTECERWCRPETPDQIVPVVAYIGPDAPQWMKRPTCPGKYNSEDCDIVYEFDAEQVGNWDRFAAVFDVKWWFGPLPAIPEELK